MVWTQKGLLLQTFYSRMPIRLQCWLGRLGKKVVCASAELVLQARSKGLHNQADHADHADDAHHAHHANNADHPYNAMQACRGEAIAFLFRCGKARL